MYKDCGKYAVNTKMQEMPEHTTRIDTADELRGVGRSGGLGLDPLLLRVLQMSGGRDADWQDSFTADRFC